MNRSNHLSKGPLSPEYINDVIACCGSDPSIGAHTVFLGRVRADPENGVTVTGIDYSAYNEMVDPVIHEITDQLYREFDDLKDLHILHSTGLVKAGEISLFVMVSAGHRRQAFRAVEQCVELIKAKLPVWKKEILSDGSERWVE
jgi:molybdopterin synthase catalytic subunit